MRIKLALVLVAVWLGCAVFFIPKQVLSENVHTRPAQRVTLLNLTPSHNFEKSSVSFRPYKSYNAERGPNKDRDLVYGGLSYNGDRDWFKVAFGPRDRSRIKDLGKLDWSDNIAIAVLPILPCPANGPCYSIRIPPPSSGKKIQDEDINPHIAKPVVGHMYLVRTYDKERDLFDRYEFDTLLDFYTLVRVEDLKPNESCTITWKRISLPKE